MHHDDAKADFIERLVPWSSTRMASTVLILRRCAHERGTPCDRVRVHEIRGVRIDEQSAQLRYFTAKLAVRWHLRPTHGSCRRARRGRVFGPPL